jgi:Tfp pilus assembly protein PilF
LNDLGYISARLKQYNEAISYYKRAISIDPNYSEAMNNLGVTYLEVENWDEAIKYFEMALRNPLYATPEKAYTNLGYALYKKGDYPDAVDTLEEVSQRYPNYPQHFYVLGLVYMKLGEYGAAIDEFKKALNIAPEYIDVHWELANAYLKAGDKKEAVKHFKIVAESGNDERSKEALKYLELFNKQK